MAHAQIGRVRKLSKFLLHGRLDHFAYALWARGRRLDFSRVSVADLGLREDRAKHHSASGGVFLIDVLRELRIPPGSRVVDLGCGKGSAMCTLARFPFEEVAGVEISPAMASIAEKNLRKLNIRGWNIYIADASDFTDLDRFTHVYMFNPFPEVVMADVMRNLGASLKRTPRTLTVIYFFPTCHDILIKSGLFTITRQIDSNLTHAFHIYQHQPSVAGGQPGPRMIEPSAIA